MINDLGTEATNVHTRFPYAIVAFMVIVPEPCLGSPQKEALTGTVERLSNRGSPLNSVHKAEAISLVIWKPDNGEIIPHWPKKGFFHANRKSLSGSIQGITAPHVMQTNGFVCHVPSYDHAFLSISAREYCNHDLRDQYEI